MQVLYLDGCPCCGCCGSVTITGLTFSSTDPGPYLNCNGTAHFVWYWSNGQGVYEEYVSVWSRISDFPRTLPKGQDLPQTITAHTDADIHAPIDCGTVTLPANTELTFVLRNGQYVLDPPIIVCAEESSSSSSSSGSE